MTELAVGSVGGALPAAPPGVLSRLRRRGPDTEVSPSERFWEEARGTEAQSTAAAAAGSRVRPEAGAPVVVVAERLDRRGPAPPAALGGGTVSSSGSGGLDLGGAAVLSGSSESPPRPDRMAALPVGFSAVAPHRSRAGEDPVYVPSAVSNPRGAPRQAEMEEVGGRPVWVVYRPSAGLEVGTDDADGAPGNPRTAN
jgi:hypothetical protein